MPLAISVRIITPLATTEQANKPNKPRTLLRKSATRPEKDVHMAILARIITVQAYCGTLARREIVRANAILGELRQDKEKLLLTISCEFLRVKAS